ncbi:MAG: DUF1570 domain-containing protein [Thermoguttaceae bacterium]
MLVLLSTMVLNADPALGAGDDLDRTAQQLTNRYREQLEELAAWCETRGLAEQAQKTRKWLRPHDPAKYYVAILPDKVGRDKPPDDAPADVLKWDTDLAKLQTQYASACFDLARRAIRTNRASLAFDLVLIAVHEDPDYEPVRKLLGYQQFRGQWCTPDQLSRLRSGQVWHERFGWLPKAHVARYEKGQRYTNGRWVSADEDARLHRDIQTGWDVSTEHFSIRTNHSLEAGVELGRKLERLYRVWKQLFVRYYLTEAQVSAMFDGRARGRGVDAPRHQVVYFRDRKAYNDALRPTFANIEITVGAYLDNTRRAYFFAGSDADDRTLYHEATHQLFHESRPVAPDVARRANFWIIEGIALYMESLHEEDGFHVLGGVDDLRMQAARYRLLHDDFYVPLAEFSSYGIEQFQSDKRVATFYSQAAGLTHFLVYYDGGRYRDSLVHYLTAVYSGQADANTLARLTSTSYSDLDKQYRRFIDAARKKSRE